MFARAAWGGPTGAAAASAWRAAAALGAGWLAGRLYRMAARLVRTYTARMPPAYRVSPQVYCLPDNYEVLDKSLDDIRHVRDPRFTQPEMASLDKWGGQGRGAGGGGAAWTRGAGRCRGAYGVGRSRDKRGAGGGGGEERALHSRAQEKGAWDGAQGQGARGDGMPDAVQAVLQYSVPVLDRPMAGSVVAAVPADHLAVVATRSGHSIPADPTYRLPHLPTHPPTPNTHSPPPPLVPLRPPRPVTWA